MHRLQVLAPISALRPQSPDQLAVILIDAVSDHLAGSGPVEWVVLLDDACFGIVFEVDLLFEVEHNATQSLPGVKSDKLFLTELIEARFDVALVQITLNRELVSDLVNPRTCEPNRKVNIEDPMLLADPNRYALVNNIYKVVRVSHEIKVDQLILNDVAPLVTWPLFRRDDDIISFEGLNQ